MVTGPSFWIRVPWIEIYLCVGSDVRQSTPLEPRACLWAKGMVGTQRIFMYDSSNEYNAIFKILYFLLKNIRINSAHFRPQFIKSIEAL